MDVQGQQQQQNWDPFPLPPQVQIPEIDQQLAGGGDGYQLAHLSPDSQDGGGAPGAIMNYRVRTPNGESWADNMHIINELLNEGQNVKEYSADGLFVTLEDAHGPYTVPIPHILQNWGHEVVGYQPISADETGVNREWGMAINTMPDDNWRGQYLTSKLKTMGETDPQVVGSGDNWYAFQDGKWRALTSTQGMSLGNAVNYVPGAMKAVGSAIGATAGGLLGAPTGPGAVAAAATGGGLGSAGVDALFKAGYTAADPEYRELMRNNFGTAAWDTEKEFMLGAIPGGFSGKMVSAGGAPRFLARSGPISSTVKMVSKPVEKMAPVVSDAARALAEEGTRPILLGQTPQQLGRDLLMTYNPAVNPAAGAVGLAGIAQLPRAAITAAPKMVGRFAESKVGQSLLGKERSSRWAQGAVDALSSRPAERFSQTFNRAMRRDLAPPAEDAAHAGEVMASFGRKVADWTKPSMQKVEGQVWRDASTPSATAIEEANNISHQVYKSVFDATGDVREAQRAARGAYKTAYRGGAGDVELAHEMSKQQLKNSQLANAQRRERFAKGFRIVGDVAEAVGRGGEAVTNAADSLAKFGLRRTAGFSDFMGGAARRTTDLMNYIQPFETPLEMNALLRYGRGRAEEEGLPGFQPWQRARNPSRIIVEN